MLVTEEMISGTHPDSVCRECVGKECEYGDDELSSIDCPKLGAQLAEIRERMETSFARLYRLKR